MPHAAMSRAAATPRMDTPPPGLPPLDLPQPAPAADAMRIVRADLVRRIDGIAAASGRIALAPLCEQVDGIRRIARLHGLDALERMASLLESAIAYNGFGPVILSYLDLMRDAAISEAQGPEAGTAYAAALSLRLAGRTGPR